MVLLVECTIGNCNPKGPSIIYFWKDLTINYLEFECTTQLQQIWSGEEANSEDVVAISAITSLSQHHRRGRSWRLHTRPRGSKQDFICRLQCTATKIIRPRVKAALTHVETRISWSSRGRLAILPRMDEHLRSDLFIFCKNVWKRKKWQAFSHFQCLESISKLFQKNILL